VQPGPGKLRSHGRWEGQLRLADSKRSYVYARSREQVVARLQEGRWRLTWGIPVRARGSLLGEYLQQWLDLARTQLRPRTVEAYELCIGRSKRTWRISTIHPLNREHREPADQQAGVGPLDQLRAGPTCVVNPY
jgi:hypothetical protein